MPADTFANPVRFEDEVNLAGADVTYPDGGITNSAISASADIAQSKLALRSDVAFPVPFSAVVRHNAPHLGLPGTTDTNSAHLALVGTNYGSTASTNAAMVVQSADAASSDITQRFRYEMIVPAEYAGGETATVRLRAKASALSSNATTIDVEAHKTDGTGSVDADLVTTSAATLSTSAANYDFTVTPTGLNPGDKLDVRVSVNLSNTASTNSSVATVINFEPRFDVR